MSNYFNPCGDQHSEFCHPLFDVEEPSCIVPLFPRPERFCHTLLDYHELISPKIYHAFIYREALLCKKLSNPSISVTDTRATHPVKPVYLCAIEGGWIVRNYPSLINAEKFLPTVNKAASEILSADRERKYKSDAQKFSANLLKMKEHGEQAILEYCVKLYTKSSFVFRALHDDLGDYYALDTEKLHSYEQLLHLYVERYGKPHKGIVYRGAMWNDETLKLHVGSDYDTPWYSNTYLSTSKCRWMAELFGNILIIIDIENVCANGGKAVDISELSDIPDEEEVLLTPAYLLFKAKQPEFDLRLNKHILYFTSKPSSAYSLVVEKEHTHNKTRRERNRGSSEWLCNGTYSGFDRNNEF